MLVNHVHIMYLEGFNSSNQQVDSVLNHDPAECSPTHQPNKYDTEFEISNVV